MVDRGKKYIQTFLNQHEVLEFLVQSQRQPLDCKGAVACSQQVKGLLGVSLTV